MLHFTQNHSKISQHSLIKGILWQTYVAEPMLSSNTDPGPTLSLHIYEQKVLIPVSSSITNAPGMACIYYNKK